MLESPAMRVLTLAEQRAFDRIEIEHAHHGGADNGKLPITYVDFQRVGLHPNAVAPSLRALVSLGFVEIMRKGYGGAAGVRAPDATRRDGDGTHDYLAIKTVEQAEAIAKTARRHADPPTSSGRRRSRKIQNATLTFRAISPSEKEVNREISALTFRWYRLTL
jgi:hypothetical protein